MNDAPQPTNKTSDLSVSIHIFLLTAAWYLCLVPFHSGLLGPAAMPTKKRKSAAELGRACARIAKFARQTRQKSRGPVVQSSVLPEDPWQSEDPWPTPSGCQPSEEDPWPLEDELTSDPWQAQGKENLAAPALKVELAGCVAAAAASAQGMGPEVAQPSKYATKGSQAASVAQV